jgi:beta-N-acetylhexosaminidase
VIRPGPAARRAAGRLCLVDFDGTEPSDRLERLIAECHIGGVCLFRKNVASAAQVAGLTATVQRLARAAGAPPLWISIDHEGGAVNRFPPSAAVTPLPSAMALGASGDPALAAEAGRVAGEELRAMGIHLNFAPVLDVNNNPANPVIGARSFGASPALVAAMGTGYMAGLQAAGVGAVAKHFPGHGDVTIDSHLALPRVDHAVDHLTAVELAPFRAVAQAGVAAVMTAHIVFPALDPSGAPATMSAPILRGILREQWGYRGLIVSDSLGMRAIVDNYEVGEAAVAAVRAGCDLLLALGPEAWQDQILERVARAIECGDITVERVSSSLARLTESAARWGVGAEATAADAPARQGHADVARRIAEAAVTVVRNRAGVIPLRGGRLGVLPATPGSGGDAPAALVLALRRCHPAVVEVGSRDAAADLDALIAVTCTRGSLSASEAALVRDLHRRYADRLIVVAAGDPYDLLQCPDVAAYVATYGPDPPSMDAAARVLTGLIPARGRLPVNLPGLHAAGWGVCR